MYVKAKTIVDRTKSNSVIVGDKVYYIPIKQHRLGEKLNLTAHPDHSVFVRLNKLYKKRHKKTVNIVLSVQSCKTHL